MPDRSNSFPDFVLIGAMKSASTSLAELLGSHPDACMSVPKEPGFFSRDERFAKGEDWYSGFFKAAEPGHLIGEASTCYSRLFEYPDAARRLHEFNPRVKLVYLVRDPVRRTYSHYRHIMQERIAEDRNSAIPTFAQALDAYPELIDTSDYIRQIDHYLSIFPREQFYCLVMEELLADPEAEYFALCRFLGLPAPQRQRPISLDMHNAAGTALAAAASQESLASVSSRVPPIIKRWFPKPRREALRRSLLTCLRSRNLGREQAYLAVRLPSCTDEDAARLRDELRASVSKLQAFMGREIRGWALSAPP